MGMIETTLEVDAPVDICFDMWACAECLTCFMRTIESAECQGNDYIWHWQVADATGKSVQWETVVDVLEENKLISWHSVDYAVADTSGAVQFNPLHENRTRIHIEMMFNPPVKAGEFVDEVFGKKIEQMVLEDLNSFKRMVEKPEMEVTHTAIQPAVSKGAKNLTPLSIRVHGRTHEIRDEPAI